MAEHNRFSLATDVKVYFCAPPTALATQIERKDQRATAAVPPQRKDVSGINQNRLNAIARRLNERSGETLGFESR